MTNRKWICLILFILFPVLGASAAHAQRSIKRNHDFDSPAAVTGHDWALVIGINEYEDPDVPDLATAINDARAVADLLERRLGFDRSRIIELYDGDATREKIIDALTRLIRQTEDDDRVLIYYAGHGELWYKGRFSFQIRDKKDIQEMKQHGRGFWIPASARLGKTSGYLSNAELRNYLTQLDVDHLLLVSDSCYSGGLTERGFDPRYPEESLEESIQLRSRLLLSSGGLHPVPDESNIFQCSGHSTFACYFLKFLKEASPGFLTTRNLYARLYEPVIYNSKQEPRLEKFLNMGHEGGQFVFTIQQPSLLSVQSNVSGAWVRLNDREMGMTPLDKTEVGPGEYRLSVGKENYETEQRSILMKSGENKNLYVSLKKNQSLPRESLSFLSVESNVQNASVKLNGEVIGITNLKGKPIPSGSYRLTVEKTGYTTYQQDFKAREGRSQSFNVDLSRVTPVTGRLYIETDPRGAGIRILNTKPEFYQGIVLKSDTYEVEISANGYETKTVRVNLAAGEDKRVLFRLAKIPPVQNSVQQYTNFLGMKFQYLPNGTFYMGTPSYEKDRDKDEVRHFVKLTSGFYLQTTEVTQGQWKRIMGNNPSDNRYCGDECPVERVSWYDVMDFIKRLNRKDKRSYRLPTEAEWEYACRAGSDTSFSYGDDLHRDQANFESLYGKTLPVKRFTPNGLGFYDMHGNVSEWCQDWYNDYPKHSVSDPSGGAGASNRKVVRGGGWNDKKRYCRSGNRSRVDPKTDNANNVGFRLVMIVE